jgi:hypothetical protein
MQIAFRQPTLATALNIYLYWQRVDLIWEWTRIWIYNHFQFLSSKLSWDLGWSFHSFLCIPGWIDVVVLSFFCCTKIVKERKSQPFDTYVFIYVMQIVVDRKKSTWLYSFSFDSTTTLNSLKSTVDISLELFHTVAY